MGKKNQSLSSLQKYYQAVFFCFFNTKEAWWLWSRSIKFKKNLTNYKLKSALLQFCFLFFSMQQHHHNTHQINGTILYYSRGFYYDVANSFCSKQNDKRLYVVKRKGEKIANFELQTCSAGMLVSHWKVTRSPGGATILCGLRVKYFPISAETKEKN